MIEKELLDSIMDMTKDCTLDKFASMSIMAKHCPIGLLDDENTHKLYYQCKLFDVLKSDLTNEQLVDVICHGGWRYSDDKKYLVLYL